MPLERATSARGAGPCAGSSGGAGGKRTDSRPRSPGSPRSVPLPVLKSGATPPDSGAGPGPSPRGFGRTRTGRKRAIVLGIVHLLFLAHLTHWFANGRTISPVEPSEAMYTLERGMVNAGAIFFSLAILSTLIFGRFFCGWGCHVVALQDLCAYLLSRVGVRPRMFRARLLRFVPLFFALYMFVWPTFKREALFPLIPRVLSAETAAAALAWFKPVAPFPGFTNHVTTSDFWATFTGPLTAIPFLFVCGFACVYFLGAKGFCTYGCPYGGFFAPLEQLAPGRILVDHDKCEGCGRCTATCTSNVRVHEEIRDFGMVVSAGCMKCMDCVAVCPNEALSFGFAPPPILKSRKRGRATTRRGLPDKPRTKRSFDLAWPEELLLLGVFTGSFLLWRGAYGGVPMLMAIGVAGCLTFLVWKAIRLPFSRNLTLHNFRLRLGGRVTGAGIGFLALTLAALALTGQAGAVKMLQARAGRIDDEVRVSPDVVFSGAGDRSAIGAPDIAKAKEAIRLYERSAGWRAGGIGLASTPEADVRLAWLHSVTGDFGQAERALRRVEARGLLTDTLALHLAQIIALEGRSTGAEDFVRECVARHPRFDELRARYADQLLQRGRAADAEKLFRDALARDPRNARSHLRLGVLLMGSGRLDDAIASLQRAAALDPRSAAAHAQLGLAFLRANRFTDAEPHTRRAMTLAPNDPVPVMHLAEILLKTGRASEASEAITLAERLQRDAGAPALTPDRRAPSGDQR